MSNLEHYTAVLEGLKELGKTTVTSVPQYILAQKLYSKLFAKGIPASTVGKTVALILKAVPTVPIEDHELPVVNEVLDTYVALIVNIYEHTMADFNDPELFYVFITPGGLH